MPLTLSVLTYRNQPPAKAMSATFTQAGGTIGRLQPNTLELPDPDRVISRTHAKVTCEGGDFTITNTGQNPIDLNGRPLGANERARLSSGDRVTIGDYVLECGVTESDGGGELAAFLNRPAAIGEPPTAGIVSAPGEESAFGIPLMGGAERARPLDTPAPGPIPVMSPAGQQRDRVPGYREPLTSAERNTEIPEDFNLLQGLESADPARPAPAGATGLRGDPGRHS